MFDSYPVAGSPDHQSQSLSPPTPAQRPRTRMPSPSPSWEYVPMPGALPATPHSADEPTLPHHGTISADYLDNYDTEEDWNSSPIQPVEASMPMKTISTSDND